MCSGWRVTPVINTHTEQQSISNLLVLPCLNIQLLMCEPARPTGTLEVRSPGWKSTHLFNIILSDLVCHTPLNVSYSPCITGTCALGQGTYPLSGGNYFNLA